eukprot:gene10649-1936_t
MGRHVRRAGSAKAATLACLSLGLPTGVGAQTVKYDFQHVHRPADAGVDPSSHPRSCRQRPGGQASFAALAPQHHPCSPAPAACPASLHAFEPGPQTFLADAADDSRIVWPGKPEPPTLTGPGSPGTNPDWWSLDKAFVFGQVSGPAASAAQSLAKAGVPGVIGVQVPPKPSPPVLTPTPFTPLRVRIQDVTSSPCRNAQPHACPSSQLLQCVPATPGHPQLLRPGDETIASVEQVLKTTMKLGGTLPEPQLTAEAAASAGEDGRGGVFWETLDFVNPPYTHWFTVNMACSTDIGTQIGITLCNKKAAIWINFAPESGGWFRLVFNGEEYTADTAGRASSQAVQDDCSTKPCKNLFNYDPIPCVAEINVLGLKTSQLNPFRGCHCNIGTPPYGNNENQPPDTEANFGPEPGPSQGPDPFPVMSLMQSYFELYVTVSEVQPSGKFTVRVYDPVCQQDPTVSSAGRCTDLYFTLDAPLPCDPGPARFIVRNPATGLRNKWFYSLTLLQAEYHIYTAVPTSYSSPEPTPHPTVPSTLQPTLQLTLLPDPVAAPPLAWASTPVSQGPDTSLYKPTVPPAPINLPNPTNKPGPSVAPALPTPIQTMFEDVSSLELPFVPSVLMAVTSVLAVAYPPLNPVRSHPQMPCDTLSLILL